MVRRFAALLACSALLVPAGAAEAATTTVRDTYNGSTPTLNVKRGTFTYTDRAAVIRVRFEDLSRRKTMLGAKYLRRDETTIVVGTKFVGGRKRVIVHRSDPESYDRINSRHVHARWDFTRNVIRIRIGAPLLAGNSAAFLAWSQRKNAQHGLPGGRDELYVPRLRRD